MVLTTLAQAVHHVVAFAAPAPSSSPDPSEINTNGIVSFLATKIAPILLAILGVIFLGRAGKGEMSKVLTSSAIAIIGLVFIAGAVSLFFVGDYIVRVAFK